MLSVSKPASLVEQKKQQWAREREEMSHLYLPWSSGSRYDNRQYRNQFASTLELHKNVESDEPIQRQRSPSLPPIHNIEPNKQEKQEIINRNLTSAKRFAFYDEDGEGDTSGYGSETINHRNNIRDMQTFTSLTPVATWQNHDDNHHRPSSAGRTEAVWSSRSPRNTVADEGRPRWGDRGVATGRLWEPTAPTSRLPQMQNQTKGTPSWVERGLNMIDNNSAEVLVIDQGSSTTSGFECDRSSCNGSDEGRTYLRGQNVPLEPEQRAHRENKRIKALELQSAILNQLEEQEKRRQEERERKLREERLEELRIQKQQEEDRIKIEEEKRKIKEKQVLEQKKLETLKKALENAELKAKQEKEKRFSTMKPNVDSERFINKDNEVLINNQIKNEDEVAQRDISSPKSSRTYEVHTATSQIKQNEDRQTTGFSSPRSNSQGNLNLFIQNVSPLNTNENQNHYSIIPISINGDIISSVQQNGVQLAVLVPQNLNNVSNFPINSSSNTIETESTKVLTPRKYRSMKIRDASTQTDYNICKNFDLERINEAEDGHKVEKTYPSIDENAPQDHNKKDRRFRTDERFRKELENRPKWGVNRPAAQYKKQSEKDPFYTQKRKIRHRYRSQPRQYVSHSSEDSRSPSPTSEKHNEKQRNSLTQSYWKNKRSSQDLQKPNSVSENSNSPPSDNGHVNVVERSLSIKKTPENKLSPSKRLTLSQKFINDKYGNRKLWTDDSNDIYTKTFNVEDRKKMIDQLNMVKRNLLEHSEN